MGSAGGRIEYRLLGSDATLTGLQRLAKDGVVRRHVVIERDGIRFGIFGLLGKKRSSIPVAPARLSSPIPSRSPGRW